MVINLIFRSRIYDSIRVDIKDRGNLALGLPALLRHPIALPPPSMSIPILDSFN